MASIVTYDRKPKLTSPAFIECLPGIGNVGKLAGDFFAEALKAKRFAVILSEHFPAQVIPDEDCVVSMASNELWHANVNGRDIIFLRGECQGSTSEGQFQLCREILDATMGYDLSEIITLGGYGTGLMVDDPRVLGAVSNKKFKSQFSKIGVEFSPGEPQAGIVGASGVLLGLGKMYGIPSICLMGETSGYFLDHKSAMAVVRVLMKRFGVDIDLKDLMEKSEHIDALTAKVKEFEDSPQSEDLSYIR
ncbi:MAG: proteasome assembly chaperone family protein [Candidatus Methanoplasma sp.]|jgi:uncharacterized protein (TIGR00162 family)|nr:proteasome assembly chaperone family protein [Candidatus Methanoplasma sp.]